MHAARCLPCARRPTIVSASSPFLEEQQRRNAADGEASGHVRVLVDVQLGNRRAAVEFRGERVDGRRQTPARTAPLRPEIDQHDARSSSPRSKLLSVNVFTFSDAIVSSPRTD